MSETANANVYTEAQHFALLTSAVERETASLSEAKETLETQVGTLKSETAAQADELATLKSRLDVTEAEKAAAEARAEAAAKEFADFKADLELQAQVAQQKSARVDRVKSANTSLGEDFFTEERAQRWAEMSEAAFEALVADLTEAAAAGTRAPGMDDGGDAKNKKKGDQEMARESAAFTGGQTATSDDGESTLARLLARRRGAIA